MPDLEVRASAIAGLGLFTVVERREGERIAEITGEVISAAEAERRDGLGNVYIYEYDDETYVDAATSLGRHVNHACAPTCRIESSPPSRLWLVAARDLPAGTELTIDYDYEDIFEACKRHNPDCRGAACPRAREAASA